MHQPIQVGNVTYHFHKSRHETNGAMDIFEMIIPPQAQLGLPHLHREYEETIVGIDGIATWTLGSEIIPVGPGDQLVIPRGVQHSYANLQVSTARIMCILTPGLLGPEYFQELASFYNGGKSPDFGEIGALMTRYGVIPASL
jgi:mannose-6-phosphate isomerase-like protein (cupin superfamily)